MYFTPFTTVSNCLLTGMRVSNMPAARNFVVTGFDVPNADVNSVDKASKLDRRFVRRYEKLEDALEGGT